MKAGAVLALSVAVLSGGVFGGSRIFNGARYYGPYTCSSSCQLATPSPDAATLAYIRSMDGHNAGSLPDFAKVVGDAYAICDGANCVTYTRSDSIDYFFGGAVTPIRHGGGGGGGRSGPPSTGGPPAGCTGNCGGTVIVGDPEKEGGTQN